jgi:hypothetical protein
VKTGLKNWLAAFLVAQFACLQMLVAMHRVAHLLEHEGAHSTSLHTKNLKHAGHVHDDHSRSHDDSLVHHAFGFFPDHQSKIDCDRFDACSGGDIVATQLSEASFATPEPKPLNRIDLAYVATRSFRATARAPPQTA